jgi:hypothetical protein
VKDTEDKEIVHRKETKTDFYLRSRRDFQEKKYISSDYYVEQTVNQSERVETPNTIVITNYTVTTEYSREAFTNREGPLATSPRSFIMKLKYKYTKPNLIAFILVNESTVFEASYYSEGNPKWNEVPGNTMNLGEGYQACQKIDQESEGKTWAFNNAPAHTVMGPMLMPMP